MELQASLEPLTGVSCDEIATAFGNPEMANRLRGHLREQSDGSRVVVVARRRQLAVGYGCLLWRSPYPPFASADIAEIQDLNVVPSARRTGIASMLLDELEALARERGCTIGIGFGLYADYGPAQQLYVRRGYVPDGNGVYYGNSEITPGSTVRLDDDLVLHLTKRL